MRRISSALEVARQTLCLLAGSKMVWLLLGLCGLLAAVFGFIPRRAVRENLGDELFGTVAYVLLCQFAMPFTALYFGLQAVHADLEDRTSTYAFLRPVPRSSLLLGKWLAATVVTIALSWCAVGALYGGLAVVPRPWRGGIGPDVAMAITFALGIALAVPAYVAVGALCGAWFRRPLLIAIAFLIGWEVIVSVLPPEAGVRGATVADPMRRWLEARVHPTGDLAEVLSVNMRGFDPGRLGDPARAIVRFTLIALALALLGFTRREYDSRPRD